MTLLPIACCTSVDSPEAARFAAPTEYEPATTGSAALAPQEQSTAKTTHHDKSGPLEFTLGGAGISNDRVNAGSGQVAGSVGYYLSKNLEVLVRQNASIFDAGDGYPDVWTGASRLAIDLHFPLGNFVPYVGASLGWAYGSGIHDSFLGGPEAGVKLYLKDDVFVLFGAEYQVFFDNSDALNNAFDDGQILYGLSLGVRF